MSSSGLGFLLQKRQVEIVDASLSYLLLSSHLTRSLTTFHQQGNGYAQAIPPKPRSGQGERQEGALPCALKGWQGFQDNHYWRSLRNVAKR
jgi:hypothetical protein